MMTKRENQQIEMHLITIEDLVPMLQCGLM